MNLAAFDEMLEALRAVDKLYVFFDTIVPPELGGGARAVLGAVRDAIEKAEGAAWVSVSLDDNALTYRDKRVVLKRMQTEVVSVLAERMPNTVSREYLTGRVWGLDAPTTCHRCLDQHVMRLRRALEPIGLNIFTTHGRGYRLDVA